MSRMLTGFAALALMGAAALPLSANAAEQQSGIKSQTNQITEVSSQRHWRGRHYGYYGHRYWGPRYRYGYYGPRYYRPYRYGYYDGPYGYYRPAPLVGFGIGPFGFRVF